MIRYAKISRKSREGLFVLIVTVRGLVTGTVTGLSLLLFPISLIYTEFP